MTSLESAVWIIVRAILGIFLSVAFAASTWVLSRLFLQNLTLDATTFFVTQSLIIGIPAGIGAAAAWWNQDSPRILRVLAAIFIPTATFVCAWLTVEIRGVYTYHALFDGSRRIPVIDTGDILTTLIASSVIAANGIAAALYLYRLIRHRET